MIELVSKVGIKNKKSKKISISLSNLNEGINSTDDFFIKKSQNKISWVINRTCDHNYGKLIIKKHDSNHAICPVHNWKLDLNNLKYTNQIQKKKVEYKIIKNEIKIKKSEQVLKFLNTSTNSNKNYEVEIRYLSHASVLISYNNVKFLTDPWFLGPAFCNGWWLREEPKFDFEKLIKNIDFIFISHNHPDHLHIETLKKFNKSTKIITPKFPSNSTKILLSRLGFENIYDLSFNNIYKIKKQNIYFSLLKSGDFREDSGIYFQINGKKILLNVDSNNLNGGLLPQNIDLLMSSFAGGASGFPLCFENYDATEKKRILLRNKKALFNMVIRLVKLTKCKNFIPYAGFFSEKAQRDKFIYENNQKNNFEELLSYSKTHNLSTKIVDFNKFDTINFGKKTIFKKLNIKKQKKYNVNLYTNNYINLAKKQYLDLSKDFVKEYFLNSGFRDNLVLYLIPTDDKFRFVKEGFIIDFSNKHINFKNHDTREVWNKYQNSKNGVKRHLLIKARNESLNMVLSNKLPWEDLLIGFQCRILRKPNIYNSNFWQHFTNKYIDKVNFRYNNPCGSCETLFQQVY